MKKIRSILILMGILILGSLLYVGCSGGGTPGGGLDFFTSGEGTGVGPTISPTPTPTPGTGETVIAEGRVNTYDLAISGGYAYWTEKTGSSSGGVYRRLLGSDKAPIEPVAVGHPQAYSLCIAGDFLYFTEKVQTTGKVIQVNLASATPPFTAANLPAKLEYVTGLNQPLWIREHSGVLFWTEYNNPDGHLFAVSAFAATTEQTDNVVTVASGLHFPFRFYIDPDTGLIFLTELSGDGSRILMIDGLSVFEVFSGIQCYYGTGITYDSSGGMIYWCNLLPNSGVFRIPITLSSTGGAPTVGSFETVETGLNRAFDIQGPFAGEIYFSLNEPRAANGNIYSELITNIALPAGTDLASGTITDPFRFIVSGVTGKTYYWTEFAGFDPTNLDAGGNASCRVMQFQP